MNSYILFKETDISKQILNHTVKCIYKGIHEQHYEQVTPEEVDSINEIRTDRVIFELFKALYSGRSLSTEKRK